MSLKIKVYHSLPSMAVGIDIFLKRAIISQTETRSEDLVHVSLESRRNELGQRVTWILENRACWGHTLSDAWWGTDHWLSFLPLTRFISIKFQFLWKRVRLTTVGIWIDSLSVHSVLAGRIILKWNLNNILRIYGLDSSGLTQDVLF
jgi:hypothetical protein